MAKRYSRDCNGVVLEDFSELAEPEIKDTNEEFLAISKHHGSFF